jgi:hypothetical protein
MSKTSLNVLDFESQRGFWAAFRLTSSLPLDYDEDFLIVFITPHSFFIFIFRTEQTRPRHFT